MGASHTIMCQVTGLFPSMVSRPLFIGSFPHFPSEIPSEFIQADDRRPLWHDPDHRKALHLQTMVAKKRNRGGFGNVMVLSPFFRRKHEKHTHLAGLDGGLPGASGCGLCPCRQPG